MIEESRYGWKAHANQSLRAIGRSVDIWLYSRGDNGLTVVDSGEQMWTYRTIREDDGAQLEPSMTLNDEQGRALLDALIAHYGAGSDLRRLFDDVKFERARGDRMLDALLSIAQNTALRIGSAA